MGQYWDPIEREKRSMSLTPQMRRDGLTHHMDTTYQAMRHSTSPIESIDGQYEIDLQTFFRIVPMAHWSCAEEHPFGAPLTIDFDSMQVSLSTIEFAYIVWRLKRWLTRASSLLEIGGGYGGLTRILRKYSPSLDITIVDLAPMLAIQQYYLQHTAEHAVWLSLSIPADQSYDLIVATRVLCELDLSDTNDYLTEINDHLKPGGIFYCVYHERCINNHEEWIIPQWDLVDERKFPFQIHKHWLEKIWMKPLR